MTDSTSTATPSFPLIPLAIAGLIGEIVFELYAWFVSPVLFGKALEPTNLVIALTKMSTGIELSYGMAFPIHFLIGAFGFALFFWIVHRVTGTSLMVAGFIAGLILWFVAQGILAPVVGRDFMMGFGPYTQSSFVGHVGMCMLMAALFAMLSKRQTPSMA